MSEPALLQAALLALEQPVLVFDDELRLVLLTANASRVAHVDRTVKAGVAMEALEQPACGISWRGLARELREFRKLHERSEASTHPGGERETQASRIVMRAPPGDAAAVRDRQQRITTAKAYPLLAEAPASDSLLPSGGDRSTRPSTRPSSQAAAPRRLIGWMVELEVSAVADLPHEASNGSLGPSPQHHEASDVECFFGMWTRDPALKRTFRVLERVAGQPVPVLVRGETGTGKELAAQALHQLSPRREGPFRAINCAAVPANLIESELFGHVRGAFTGAIKDTPGHFQLANGGTLFLDEIAELPLELQAKLLRVVETQAVLPIGARQPQPIDVRIISATHRSLRSEVEAGRFRADLMYRLRVIPVFLPPLRQRVHDIELLAEQFLARLNQSGERAIQSIANDALQALRRYDYPGNVRELKNILQYAYVIGEGDELRLEDLPPELSSPLDVSVPADESGSPRPQLPPPSLEAEGRHPSPAFAASAPPSQQIEAIERALAMSHGKRSAAARSLGMSRITLWRKMRALGMVSDDP